jgi:hypothetical protein
MATRTEVPAQPSERIQALFVVIGLVVLALLARVPTG